MSWLIFHFLRSVYKIVFSIIPARLWCASDPSLCDFRSSAWKSACFARYFSRSAYKIVFSIIPARLWCASDPSLCDFRSSAWKSACFARYFSRSICTFTSCGMSGTRYMISQDRNTLKFCKKYGQKTCYPLYINDS